MTRMRLIRRSLLSLLAVLVAETTLAQSMPVTAGSKRPQHASSVACPEPSNPQAVAAEVNLCNDRLIDADVQDIPGARLDLNVVPQNDPELLAAPDENQFPSPARPPGATSWSPHATLATASIATPAVSRSTGPSVLQPSAAPALAPAEAAGNSSFDLASASTLARKLTRNRLRTQEEARLRQSRQQQKDLNQVCRQMHLSDLECRLKLKAPKLATIGHQTVTVANSPRQANR